MSTALNARRILIVEDDNIVQLHLRVLLQELGYVVSGVASSAEEALASAAASPPDVVLMDVRLRGERDGIEAARELRTRFDSALVFLTAYADEETVDRALSVGAQGYIVKPFSKPQLRAALSTALAEYDKRQAAEQKAAPEPRPASMLPSGPLRPFGPGTRMAIFSHDTLGLGHLQRCTNIARALTARHPGLSVLLLTGSPAVHRYTLPEGVDYVKLPSVRKVASEQYSARSLGVSDEDVLRLRTNLILRSLQDYDPHVLLVDHAPTGMKGEMLPALEWLGRERPDCVRLLGLRDVIDDPNAVRELWSQRGVYDLLRQHYDHLLVYGQESIFQTARAYALPEELAGRTRYCNYVGEDEDALDMREVEPFAQKGEQLVVVTIGGGDGAGELVIGSYLAMLREAGKRATWRSVILPGPFLPAELADRFRGEIAELENVDLLEFVPSTSPFMARADLVVCTGGYNTTTQMLRYGRRALMIPRVMHRQEQILRARRLAELGLVRLLEPDAVTTDGLLASVAGLLGDRREPLAEARERGVVRFDGAQQVAEFCAGLMVRSD